MNCEVCSEIYNDTNHKPYTLIPCGHTYCLDCIERLKSLSEQAHFKCNHCNEPVEDYKPSYAIMKILDQKLCLEYSDLKLKQTVFELINNINDMKTSIYFLKEKKVKDNQYKINVIKNEISNQSTDLLNILLNNQEKIVQQADSFQKNLVNTLKLDSLEEERFLHELDTKDLNQVERGELSSIKTNLMKIKSNLTFKSNLLNEIDLGLESNNFFNLGEIKIGEIKVNESQRHNLNQTGSSNLEANQTNGPLT